MSWRLGEELVGTWLGAMGRVSVYGGLAVAVAWLICRALPRMSPAAKSWLWRLVYLKLVLLILWHSPIPVPLLPSPHLRIDRVQAPAQAGSAVREPSAAAGNPSSGPGKIPTASPARSGVRLAGIALLALWLGGVLVIVLRTITGVVATRKTLRESRPLADPWIEEEWAVLSRRLGRRRNPALLVHGDVSCPQAVGMLRPVVLFPASFVHRFSAREIRLVLAHELAHIRRRDLLWGWVRRAMNGLLFFHPLVWVAAERAALADEIACDETALRSARAAVPDYAGALLKITEQSLLTRRGFAALLGTGMSRGYRAVAGRLQALQQMRELCSGIVQRRRRWATLVGWLTALALLPWGLLTWFQRSGIRQIDRRYPVLGFKVSRGRSHNLSVRREVCRIAGFTLSRAVEDTEPVQPTSPAGTGTRSSSMWTANAAAAGTGAATRVAAWLRKLGLKPRLDTAKYSAGVYLGEESCSVIVRFAYNPKLTGYEDIGAALVDEQGETIPLVCYLSEIPAQSGEFVKFWVVSPAPVTRSKFSLRLRLADQAIADLRISEL